jgi:hypothetical protein
MLFVNNAIISILLEIGLTFSETKFDRFTSAQDGFVDLILDRSIISGLERGAFGTMDSVIFLLHQQSSRKKTYHDINTARRVQLVIIHICSHGIDERDEPIT